MAQKTSISDEILKTIQYAIDRIGIECDKTFVSVIKKVNTDKTYIILDEGGNERTVKSSIPNLPLKIGTSVWVKIPCGNLKRIHICGIV